MTTEIWKDIIGYEGLYQISDFGRVKSLSKTWICGNRHSVRHRGEIFLRLATESNGYLQVWLSKDKKPKNCLIHRLVASAFIKNTDNKKCVNHKNGIKSDNRVENLEWVTHSENTIHAFDNALRVSMKGEKHHQAKLTEESVLAIRKLKGTHTQLEIANKFKIGRRTISQILNRETWKHI